jgi:hypothetical protein
VIHVDCISVQLPYILFKNTNFLSNRPIGYIRGLQIFDMRATYDFALQIADQITQILIFKHSLTTLPKPKISLLLIITFAGRIRSAGLSLERRSLHYRRVTAH